MRSRNDCSRPWVLVFFFSSRRRHTRLQGDLSSDVCSSDLGTGEVSAGATRFAAEGTSDANRADRKSTRLNSSHLVISYAVFCLKKKQPYLVEREGTNCETLPETHNILQDVRRKLDEQFTGVILLAEAHQWPTELLLFF